MIVCEPNRYKLSSCADCRHVPTASRLGETDITGLYGTYYPCNSYCADDEARKANKDKHTFAGLVRWWNGTDYQGQESAHAGEVTIDVGCNV